LKIWKLWSLVINHVQYELKKEIKVCKKQYCDFFPLKKDELI